jgi:DNA (cytosine-5)-methyltransferase 1
MLNALRSLSNFARGQFCQGARACLSKSATNAQTAVDLFCGYGGVTAGMVQAGLNVRLAVDFNAQAVRAHRAWHPEIPCKLLDVSQIRPRELAGRFVWASPSCRPWSYANTTGTRGMAHPEYFSLVKLLHLAVASKCLVIENVVGLLERKDGREELKKLESESSSLGVSFQVVRVSASQFGLEQKRERVFIILGAPLVWCVNAPRCDVTHASVTTKGNEALQTISDLQRLQNPLELSTPDFRSGRHFKRGQSRAIVSPHAARRLVGNAIPPVMAAAVCSSVLEAFTQRGVSNA